jgi:hypothetical protein
MSHLGCANDSEGAVSLRRRLLVFAVITTALTAAPAAQADVLKQLYAPLHVNPRLAPSASFIKSHFPTISVHPEMVKKGYLTARTGFYTKGTRSAKSNYPLSYYLLTASGKRIKDSQRHNFFVMNPSSSGWRKEVAKACAPSPQWCFVDAMGEDAYTRVTAKPAISQAQWDKGVEGLATYLTKVGTYRVMANNLIWVKNPPYAVGYEMFARVPSQKSLQVLKNTPCYCFIKLGTVERARYGFSLFLSGYDGSDRVSVGTDTQPGKWWPFFNKGAKLGSALGPATVSGGLITRPFEHGMVVVNGGSTSKSITMPGAARGAQQMAAAASVTIGPRDGTIILN